MKTISRRQFFGLAAVAAASSVLAFPHPAKNASIIVEQVGTLEEALKQSGRAVLAEWPLDGVPRSYIAAFDGTALSLHGSAHAFSVRHNGEFVVGPLAGWHVSPGDEILVAVIEC